VTTRSKQIRFTLAVGLALATTVPLAVLPAAGSWLLLHGARRIASPATPAACEAAAFTGAGVDLAGWRCRTTQARRGTLVYLHGISDNRRGARGLIDRFNSIGLDVVAYDSRAHGESTGDACTYGFYEKQDLRRVIDTLAPGPVVLLGHSLGAAVALQEAATDPRVATVIAAEPFSDLRTIATDRAPVFFTPFVIRLGLALAEWQAGFSVDDVSSVNAAARLTIPVLLIHGDSDWQTRPEHSRRIEAALGGPKRLMLVRGAGHSESLRGEVWPDIERWVDEHVGGVLE
jgi:uncharacterized protein